MATNDLLSEIVDPKAKQELYDLRKDVKETIDAIVDGSKKVQGAFSGITMSKDLSEMLKGMNSVAEVQKKTADQVNKLADSYKAQMNAARLATEASKEALNVEKALVEVARQDTEATKQNTEAQKQWTEVSKQAINVEKSLVEVAKQDTEASKQKAAILLAEAKATTEASKQEQIRTNVIIALTKEAERLEKQAEKEAANVAKQQGAYYNLNKEYREAALNAKNLGAQQVLLQREIEQMTSQRASNGIFSGFSAGDIQAKEAELAKLAPILADAQKKGLGLSDSLHSIELAVGQGQRKVGQYNEVGAKLRDILRDTPSFAYSTGTGIMGISNNIGPLYDALVRASEANKVLKASGEQTVPIWKQMGKELFSVSGLLSIGVALVTIFAARMSMGGQATDKAAEALSKYKENLASIDENAYAGAAKSAAQLEVLSKVVKDTTKSETDRTAAIREMQKLAPEQLGNLKDEAFLYGNITTEISAATKALYQKAAAEASMEKFKETYKADYLLMVEQRKAQEELTAAKIRYDKLLAASASNSVAASKEFQASDGVAEQIVRIQKGIDNTQKERDKLQKEMQTYSRDAEKAWTAMAPPAAVTGTIASLQEQVAKLTETRDKQTDSTTAAGKAEINRLNGLIDTTQKLIDMLQGKEAKKTGETMLKGINELFEANRRYEQAVSDQKKQEFELSAAKNKAIYEDDTKTLQQRLDAHTLYQQDMGILARIETAKDIATIDDKLKSLADIERGYNEGKIKLTKDQIAAVRKDEETYNIERSAKTQALQVKLADTEANGINVREGIIKAEQAKFLNAEEKGLQSRLSDYEESYNTDAKMLADSYLNHEISEQKFQQKLKELRNYFNGINLREQIAEDEKLLASDQINTDQRLAIQKRLTKEKLDLTNNAVEGATLQKKNNPFGLDNSDYDDAVKVANAGMELYQEITKAMNARYQTEIDMIQKRRDAIAASAETEIAAINDSSLSAEEKEKRIASAKAQAALKDKELLKEQNALKRQQAINDKAANIAAIVQKMALAIATAFTAGPLIGQIIAGVTATILGIQLAQAIATPIPQYADGVKGHPGGMALYGEAGAEIVKEPGKAPYIVDTPTLGILPAGTDVIPMKQRSMELDMLISRGMHVDSNGHFHFGSGGGNSELLEALTTTNSELQRMRADINNKPVPMLLARNGDLLLVDQKRNGRTIYLNKRFS